MATPSDTTCCAGATAPRKDPAEARRAPAAAAAERAV